MENDKQFVAIIFAENPSRFEMKENYNRLLFQSRPLQYTDK